MYRLCATLLVFLLGCECIPPGGSRPAERYRARWDAVVETYVEHGHDYRGAPFECLRVTVRAPGLFECGGVRTDACYREHTWPTCPEIEISADAVDTAALEHELLHFLREAHGHSDPRHALDFPDFFKIMYRAHEKTHPD